MKNFLTNCFFLFTATISCLAQSNYSHTNCQLTTSAYTDISGTGTAIAMTNAQSGNSSTAQNIGFNFTFNGTVFTQFMIHADGILRFGTAAPGAATLIATNPGSTYGGVFTSTSTLFQNIVMPLFCDLVQGTATPQYHVQVTGVAPDRVCTIQWKNVRDADNSASTLEHQFENMEFQLKLYETTNNIEIVFGNWIPSANAVASRFSIVGIKASSTSFIAHYKRNAFDDFQLTEFFDQQVSAILTNQYPFRNSKIPSAGHTMKFFGKLANDINVAELYTDDFIPKTGTVTKNIQVRIKNEGNNAATNIPVTLTVSGANSFAETINIASLAPAADQVISFSAFAVPVKGNQTVNVTVAPTTDARPENNTKQSNQQVTTGRSQTYDNSKRVFAGVGFGSNIGMMAIKMYGNGSRKISQIRTRFQTYNLPFDIRIYEDGGAGGAPSASSIFTSTPFKTDSDNEFIIPVNPAVTVTGDYYIVVAQRGTINIGNEYFFQYPVASQRIFTAGLNLSNWTEEVASKPFNNIVRVFEEPAVVDVGVEKLTAPSCNYSSAEDVKFSIRNFTNAIHDYALNPVTITGFVRDQVNNITTPFTVLKNSGTIAAGGNEEVTVLTGYNFLPRGSHLFNAKTICATDEEPGNDSLNFRIFNKILVTQSPADSVCNFQPVLLTASIGYLSDHSWYSDRNLTNLIINSSIANIGVLKNDTTFYVKATDYRNCVLTDSVIIRVKKLVPPKPVIDFADTVLSHRNGFIINFTVPPLAGHTINWADLLGTALSGGTIYEVKGFLPQMVNTHFAAYALSGCGGDRDTMRTRYSDGIILNNNNPLTVCDTSFYDPGGAVANYTGTSSFTKTITPATAGKKLKFTIFNLGLGSNSIIRIYDGPSISALQIAELRNTDNGNVVQSFTASNATGELTIEFAGNATSGAGFLAGLTCEDALQYRTIASGNYNTIANWESKTINASNYTPATRLPTKGDDTVRILHTITIAGQIPVDQTIVETSGNLIIPSSTSLQINKVIPGVEVTVNGTMTVNSNGVVFSTGFTNHGKVVVNGTLINNGNINTDTLIMSGNGSPSVLSGTGAITKLQINGTAGVQINGNIRITQNLNLLNGIVTINPANFILLPAAFGPVIEGGSAVSYIDGKVRWQTFSDSEPLHFPLGDGGIYRPISLLVEQNSFDDFVEYEAEMIKAAPTTRTLPGTLTNVNSQWYHRVSITNGASFFTNARIMISYEAGDGVQNETILRVAKDDGGSNWLDIGGAGTSAITGSILSDPFTSFSDFVLANINGVVVPLNLLSFTGNKQNNNALLQLKTANEINVKHFEVQRSDNGQTFQTIGTVLAGGSVYSILDENIFTASTVVFYRLKSVDVDGRFTYSDIIKLNKQTNAALTVYPNPVGDILTISGLKQKGTLLLFNAQGQLLQQQIVTAQTITMNMSSYAKGIYLLQFRADGEVENQKIIKQ